MAGTYGKYPAIASGGGGGGTKQTAQGTTSTTFVTISSAYPTFVNISGITVSFTAATSGPYRVWGQVPMSGSAGLAAYLQIVATSGSPTLIVAPVTLYYFESANHTSSLYVFAEFTLTANTSYTFQLQGAAGGNVSTRGDVLNFALGAETM